MSTTEAPPPEAVERGPFVGLAAYTQEDADFFFGRDEERRVLISNLRASRLTLLYARSGTGKSSLLRAGVAARLRDMSLRSRAERGTPRSVPVVFSSWRDDPVGALIDAIEEAIAGVGDQELPMTLPRTRLQDALTVAAHAANATCS